MGRCKCETCGEEVVGYALLEHIRLLHPEIYDDWAGEADDEGDALQRWPDGEPVVLPFEFFQAGWEFPG